MSTTTTSLNGCHNRPLLDNRNTYWVQDGYHEFMENGRPVRGAPIWKQQEGFTAFPGCVYDKKATDPRCTGCHLIALNPDGSVNAELDPDFKEVATAPAATTQDLVYIPLIK